VSGCIEFDVWAVVVRGGSEADPNRSSVSETDGQYLEPTLLTQADGFLRGIADQLSATSIDDLDFAEKACAWTHRAMRYQFDVTSVHTTAADALAGGLGVCQDFSHIMLALCRAGGIPARYVSGHLLGEGGSHAWVEALITDRIGSRTAVAFDPTHDRPAGNNYLTVAVGRDYTDVAPTSGWFEGNCPGLLSTTKRLVPVTLGELTINPPRRHAGSC
jgi:transglutaminase-like putative cysteine protease